MDALVSGWKGSVALGDFLAFGGEEQMDKTSAFGVLGRTRLSECGRVDASIGEVSTLQDSDDRTRRLVRRL